MLSGSIMRSTRGRCSGSARALRGARGAALSGSGCAGRDLVLDGGDLRLRLGDGGLKILQRQFQLRRVQLLRFRPELRAPVFLT